jgi:site-specific DNA recombinase
MTDSPSEAEVASALAEFDSLWEALTPAEQGRVLQLLIEHVEFDGASEEVKITFAATGIQSLGDVLPKPEETAA